MAWLPFKKSQRVKKTEKEKMKSVKMRETCLSVLVVRCYSWLVPFIHHFFSFNPLNLRFQPERKEKTNQSKHSKDEAMLCDESSLASPRDDDKCANDRRTQDLRSSSQVSACVPVVQLLLIV